MLFARCHLVLLSIVLAGGCGSNGGGGDDGGGGEDDREFRLETDTPSLRPFHGASADFSAAPPASLVPGTFPATIGDVETKVAFVGDRLRFLVPYLPEGNVQLRVDLGEGVGVLDLHIEPLESVADPIGTVTAILDEDVADIDAALARAEELIAIGKAGLDARTDLEEAKTALADLRTSFLAATPDEQAIVAAAIKDAHDSLAQYNPPAMQLLKTSQAPAYFISSLSSLQKKFIKFAVKLAINNSDIVAAVAVGALAVGTVAALPAAVLVGAYVATVTKARWGDTLNEWKDLENEAFKPVDAVLGFSPFALGPLGPDYSLKAGLPHKVPLRIGVANLQPGDVNDSHKWIANVARAVAGASADSAVWNPTRTIGFAPLHREEQLVEELQLGGDEGHFEILEPVDIDVTTPGTPPMIDCGSGGPVEPHITCRTDGHDTVEFTFRLRYEHVFINNDTVNLTDADRFVVFSDVLSAELDPTCLYQSNLLSLDAPGRTPQYATVHKMCFDPNSHLVTKREECFWSATAGTCRLVAEQWSSGVPASQCMVTSGCSQPQTYVLEYNSLGYQDNESFYYTEAQPTSGVVGQCRATGATIQYGSNPETPASCSDVEALTPLSVETFGLMVEDGFCGCP